jgi:SAM-dependent methyltransferase
MSPQGPTTEHKPPTEYHLPNDSNEHARLEEQASGLAELMHDKPIHAAPFLPQTPIEILDIGCGTGIMTVGLANQFPTANVYGVDLSPVPELHTKPSNVIFIQGNILDLCSSRNDDDRFKPGCIDYTFSRLLIMGMHHWPTYISTLFTLLKPGGYAEFHDLNCMWYRNDVRLDQDWKWMAAMRRAAAAKHMDMDCGSKIAGWMRDAGFVDVRVWVYKWGIGGGWMAQHGCPEGERLARLTERLLPALHKALVPKVLGDVMDVNGEAMWSEKEIEEMAIEAERSLPPEEGKHNLLHVTVGRKPE